MQNIPGIALDNTTDQLPTVKIYSVRKNEQHSLFADLFDKHSDMIDEELALSPVSTNEKMLETAPQIDEQEQPVNAAGTKAPVRDDDEADRHDLDRRMSEEEFEEVRDDLEQYGMSDEDIADIEKKVKSEEGLTWGQFAETVADKMADMQKVELTDEQKGRLNSFFGKLGFTDTESADLTRQIEDGDFSKVMNALRKKIEAMPQDKHMQFAKEEVEAFTSAMSFSKEFTSKIKEFFGNNTMSKDVKEAFTLIRQEMANLDKRDQELVQAVGKAFAKSMGDKSKETSAARQISEAIDLKPRVAEGGTRAATGEDFRQAVESRKESLPGLNAKRNSDTANADDLAASDQDQNAEADERWNDFLSKLSQDDSQTGNGRMNSKSGNAEQGLKAGLTDAQFDSKAKAWEKVSAPKVMKQVETAMFRNLGNGTKQLTLQLTPENLGKLNIMLQVQGKEVNAVIRAENHDAAKLINENIDLIKNALENQGLKVEKLEVQTGLAGNQDSQDWFGQNQHNLARDREAMAAMRNHVKSMRNNGNDVAQDLQRSGEQAINADQGLHVIA